MEPQEVLSNLFDDKVLKILKFFLNNEGEFYLREISRLTKVSAASTFRILNKLATMQILKINEIKTAKLYSLDSSKTTEFLKSIFELDLVGFFVEKASQLKGVEEILLLGSKTKTKANVLVLGTNIDTSEVKLITGDIKEKHDFTINQMTLTKEQYEQMSSMGLYPGNKRVLFRVS